MGSSLFKTLLGASPELSSIYAARTNPMAHSGQTNLNYLPQWNGGAQSITQSGDMRDMSTTGLTNYQMPLNATSPYIPPTQPTSMMPQQPISAPPQMGGGTGGGMQFGGPSVMSQGFGNPNLQRKNVSGGKNRSNV